MHFFISVTTCRTWVKRLQNNKCLNALEVETNNLSRLYDLIRQNDIIGVNAFLKGIADELFLIENEAERDKRKGSICTVIRKAVSRGTIDNKLYGFKTKTVYGYVNRVKVIISYNLMIFKNDTP